MSIRTVFLAPWTGALWLCAVQAAGQQPSFTGIGLLPGGVSSGPRAVSADGSVIVGWGSTAAGTEAFRWSGGTGMVGLGELPGGELP